MNIKIESTLDTCPVCKGVGWLPKDFYPSYTPPLTFTYTFAAAQQFMGNMCRSCHGKGYIKE